MSNIIYYNIMLDSYSFNCISKRGHIMTHTKEWQGTKIQLVNTATRMELKIDECTQDFHNGLIILKPIELNGSNSKGDKIKLIVKPGLLAAKMIINFNGREVYKKSLIM